MTPLPFHRSEADCGFCGLSAPDEFGNRDLLEHPDCPFHSPPSGNRPVLVDLFCGEGGAAMGYYRAGFEPVGYDTDARALANYPFESHRMDALDAIRQMIRLRLRGKLNVAAVHASPPCQAHSDLQKQNKRLYRDFIAPVRAGLVELGLPYVIENVEGAPLIDPVRICGAGIPGLRVIRHRLFESNVPLEGVACPERHPLVFTHDKRKAHHGRLDQDASYVQVTGGGNCTVANKRAAMGVPWMSGHGANEAIPPAYAEHVGRQLLEHVNANRMELAA